MTYIKAGYIQRIYLILTFSCSINIATQIYIHKIHWNDAIYKINCQYLDDKTTKKIPKLIILPQSNVPYEKSQSLRDSVSPGPLMASSLITADK